MVTIGYMVGSLAPDSINRKLAQVIVSHAPEHVQMIEVDLARLPMYDRHLDDDFPAVMSQFKDEVDQVDGLLVVTPEHNQSMPAPVKNAIDILSRGDRNQLGGLKLGLVGASPSRFATINAQSQIRQFLPPLGVKLMGSPVLAVSVGDETFSDDGTADARTTRQSQKYIAAFAEFLETTP